MPFWDFANEVSVPADFTTVSGGSGSVSIVSDQLVIDSGGTSTSDYAGLVYETAIDMTKLTVIAVEMEMQGSTAGSFVFPMISLIDSSGQPAAMTQSTFQGARRIYWQDQRSGGADQFDRCIFKFKNPSATEYLWSLASVAWQTSFAHSLTYVDEDHNYVLVIIIDGTVATPRFRGIVYGNHEKQATATNNGRKTLFDTAWVDFDTGATDVDPVDNSLWFVIGNIMNDVNNADWQHLYRKVFIGEMDEPTTDAERKCYAWTNHAYTATGSFPFHYVIEAYINPLPDTAAFWVPRDRAIDATTAQVARDDPASPTTEDWVKDPWVYYDSTNNEYYIVVNVRDATSPNDCDIYIASSSTILDPTWADWTIISSPDTGEGKHEFPQLFREPSDGDWYLVYGVEKSSPTAWEIQYKTCTTSDPVAGTWSSATTLLDTSGNADWEDDGCTQPFLQWINGTFTGGTWLCWYAGYNGTEWHGNFATSTTGVTGTYTRNTTSAPVLDHDQWSTTLSGAATDTDQITVNSATGIDVGDLAYVDSDPSEVVYVEAVSGTTITLSGQVRLASGADFISWHNYSFVPRAVVKYNGTWFCWGTTFKFPTYGVVQQEWVSIYIGTAGEADPSDETWRPLRENDTELGTILPYFMTNHPAGTAISNENVGFIWVEPTAAIASASGTGYMTTNTGYWGT